MPTIDLNVFLIQIAFFAIYEHTVGGLDNDTYHALFKPTSSKECDTEIVLKFTVSKKSIYKM